MTPKYFTFDKSHFNHISQSNIDESSQNFMSIESLPKKQKNHVIKNKDYIQYSLKVFYDDNKVELFESENNKKYNSVFKSKITILKYHNNYHYLNIVIMKKNKIDLKHKFKFDLKKELPKILSDNIINNYKFQFTFYKQTNNKFSVIINEITYYDD